MNNKKIITIVLAASILSNTVTPILSYADTNTVAVSSSAENSVSSNNGKEEIIYVNLNKDGTIDGTYAVNILSGKNITDYGMYSSIKNMNSSDELTYNDGKVTGTNSIDKLYYEGVIEDAVIPWNINIKYYLDGNEISSDDIAGKSGSLEIKISITANENCNSTFFENYALQSTLLLDGDKCTDINAEGATIANVGNDKQLSYIVLPGKGADISIKASVTDFEMDSIAINGVKLNLNVDVDTNSLMDKIKELQDAISKVDNGANTLKDGSSALSDGADSLNSGITSLSTGANSLNDGIKQVNNALETLNSKSNSLVSGSKEVNDALNQISSALNSVSVSSENISLLTSASSEIQTGISSLYNGINSLKDSISVESYKSILKSNGVDIDVLQNSNTESITNLNNQIESLKTNRANLISSGLSESSAEITALDSQIQSLTSVVTLLKANNGVISGTQNYISTASSGINTLAQASATLNTKYGEFNTALGSLSTTLNGLVYNMSTLSNAINTLTMQYANLDTGIKSYTGAVDTLLKGYSEIVSGAATLVNGTNSLKSGSESLVSGISTFENGTNSLADGTNKLNEETSTLDTKVTEEIDSVTGSLSGTSDDVVSFVSDKNTNIKSVQFVIKTKAIQKEEVESVETNETEKLTVLQRFINLFK